MKENLQRTWMEVNLDNLLHNYRVLRGRLRGDVRFLGVVKANAYGCGAVPVAKKLEKAGVDYLAVACLDEAVELREAGVRLPILVFGHTPPEMTAKLIRYDITQTVISEEKAAEFNAAMGNAGSLRVHIKVDTGLGRMGFQVRGAAFGESVAAIDRVSSMPNLQVEGIYTQLAVSDEGDAISRDCTQEQYRLFRRVLAELEKRGKSFPIRHCADSGAVAYYPEMAMDMVRPGIALYGAGDFAAQLGLKPVMSVKTRIYDIHSCEEGAGIGYGYTYKAAKNTRIGILPVGYADGLYRRFSNRMSVMTKVGAARVCGQICMDMCMVDLTDLEQLRPGDTVEIFGTAQSVDDLAVMAHTTPYEIMCAVGGRVHRVYLERDAGEEGRRSAPEKAECSRVNRVSVGPASVNLPKENRCHRILRAASAAETALTGKFGFSFYDLRTGESCGLHREEPFSAGGMCKLYLLAELYRRSAAGMVDLDAPLPGGDRHTAGARGVSMRLRDSAALMMRSDGPVSDSLYQLVGPGNIRKNVLETMGLRATRLGPASGEALRMAGSPRTGSDENAAQQEACRTDGGFSTSPEDIAAMLRILYDGEWVNRTVSGEMLKLMRLRSTAGRIGKYLPRGTEVSGETEVAEGIIGDAGIVYSPAGDYVLAVFCEEKISWKERARLPEKRAAAEEILARFSREIYDVYTGEG